MSTEESCLVEMFPEFALFLGESTKAFPLVSLIGKIRDAPSCRTETSEIPSDIDKELSIRLIALVR